MKRKLLCLIAMSICSFSQAQVTEIADFGIVPTGSNSIDNKIVFMHEDDSYGKEIWVSDGTEAGTQLLFDTNPGPNDGVPFFFTAIDDIVYFQANTNQIWRTDGTSLGTYLMASSPQISNPRGFVKANGFIFFVSGNGTNTSIWRMQTTPNSEVAVSGNQFSQADTVIALDDTNVLFNGKNASGWALWRSNGIVNELILDLTTTSALNNIKPLNGPTRIEDKIYFTTTTESSGSEPWTTDGTVLGTTLLKDIYVSDNYFHTSLASNFKKVGDWVYFSARNTNDGLELWKTNGTMPATQMVKDIFPGNNDNSWSPSSFIDYNGTLYFVHNDNVTSSQIWKTDGTELGTVKVTNIPNAYLSLNEVFLDGSKLFFSMYKPETGNELWMFDLITEQASMIADIAPGTTGSSPGGFFKLNNDIFFTASPTGTFATSTYKIDTEALSVKQSIDKKVSVYPNPTTGKLYLEVGDLQNYTIEIFDIIGKKVSQFENQSTLDISNFNQGVYIMKVLDGQNVLKTQKIIKQ